jgi:hypothetical protein
MRRHTERLKAVRDFRSLSTGSPGPASRSGRGESIRASGFGRALRAFELSPRVRISAIITESIALAIPSALVVALAATLVSEQGLRRGTVFCCLLAALWPTALTGLRIFIVDWATFNADFLNSVWVAAIPAFVGAAVITYYVPARLAQRIWTSWLLIAPIGGLIVLGYSLLQPWFLR